MHSFRLVNAEGESTFVKFHWRPMLGLQSTVWDEAVKLQAPTTTSTAATCSRRSRPAHFPEWDLAVQLFTEEQAASFPFDHLDSTKLIPEELVPLKVIGRMVLDRWPDNFFAETEQVAFCPAHIVPGIDFTNDPLLQGRLFSYLDTQLSRLGGPNFHQLPINAPKCPFANHQRDGHMQMEVPRGRVAYEPESLAGRFAARDAAARLPQLRRRRRAASAGRMRAETFADHYSQARLFFRSQTPIEQAHMASALVFELSKVETPHVREAMVGHLRHIDAQTRAARRRRASAWQPLPPRPARPCRARGHARLRRRCRSSAR